MKSGLGDKFDRERRMLIVMAFLCIVAHFATILIHIFAAPSFSYFVNFILSMYIVVPLRWQV